MVNHFRKSLIISAVLIHVTIVRRATFDYHSTAKIVGIYGVWHGGIFSHFEPSWEE
jgi:hypothetical protein